MIKGTKAPVQLSGWHALSLRRAWIAFRVCRATPIEDSGRVTLPYSIYLAFAFALSPLAWGAEPCQSGPQPGERVGPYAALISTGPQRGQSHCYVCETADRPAVIIFARTMNDPLGKLLSEVDQAAVNHKAAELCAWATFLSDNEPALEPKITDWVRKQGVSNVPVGVFEDTAGPPSYRLNADADVTVLVVARQKVVDNFAFRAGELTEERIKAIMKAVPRVLKQ